MKRIVIAGATGLIGKQLVVALAGQEGVETHILVRRKPERAPTGVIVHEAASPDWPKLVAAIRPDVAISCLGTTMRVAGSKAAFRAVDLDLVTDFGNAAKGAGARHMIAVSSVGASAKASNFYLQTKGEAEAAMTRMGFDRVDFLRPGLLTVRTAGKPSGRKHRDHARAADRSADGRQPRALPLDPGTGRRAGDCHAGAGGREGRTYPRK